MLSYNKTLALPIEMTQFFYLGRPLTLIFLLFPVFCLPAFAAKPLTKPLIVSSIRPLALLVENLAGDLVDSEVLLQPGDSPHHLALRVSQVRKLAEAELVVWVGPEFELFLEKPLVNKASLALASLVKTPHQHAEHTHGEQHLWLDPEMIKAFAKAFAARMGERFPEYKSQLESRAEAFLREFAHADAQTRAQFAQLEGGFITYHPALNEYVSAYKLKQIATVLEGSEHSPSVKRVADLRKVAPQTSCMLADGAELETAKRYAALLELSVQKIDILGVDPKVTNWFEYYAALREAVTSCLKPQA